jgi:hypothetical protein
MRLTKRQKQLASWINPTYGGYATKEEVKRAKKLACAHYWYDEEFEEFISISPTGIREYFPHELYSWAPWNKKKKWKETARKAAKYWAAGNSKESKIAQECLWSLR